MCTSFYANFPHKCVKFNNIVVYAFITLTTLASADTAVMKVFIQI